VKPKTIAYWATTAMLALIMVSGGVAYLIQYSDSVAGVLLLGYPLYFVTILGFWKVLGGIAILVPRFPRLKEWAYAGIFLELTGAFASHVSSGSGAEHLVVTGLLALLTLVSWALRPPSRTLGVLFPTRDRGWPLPASQGAAAAAR
jgi:uncharacterized membrane protein YphA (DoxX/SURF4 family)